MSEHTKGPWEISKIGNNYDQYVVYAEADTRGANIVNTVEGEANARLIAAAPDLLEACKKLLTASQILDGSELPTAKDIQYFLDCCEETQSAISKAEQS
jgi:hypothetical protein